MDVIRNCITGNQNFLYEHLKDSFNRAVKVDIIVSFLMESGVKLLADDLKALKERGVLIRVLTGNYMNVTQPSALYLLKDILGNDVDLRFYNDPRRSFHAKSYFIEYEKGADLYIGSSNLSKSALTSGIEWNFRINRETHEDEFDYYKSTFEDLFLNHSIIVNDEELDRYSKGWKKNKIFRTPLHNIVGNEEAADYSEEREYVANLFEPRGAQIEALYHLKKTREEGFDKGLVVAATGIGKTYLSAFDSKSYKKILFVAHREEILKQAFQSYRNIRPQSDMGFFMGTTKDTDKDIIFASVQSLGKQEFLSHEYFSPDYFDYVVIDEFHHAVANNYQKIINYFKPKFLLGITATPNRLDNQDVAALCDYNIVYEAPLFQAINQGWLVPFRYYGIYDDTVDYADVEMSNGKYQSQSLEEALSIHKRANLVLNNYQKYRSKRALGFCSSKYHADFMAKYFNEHGVKACAVYSGEQSEYTEERSVALQKLRDTELSVIFSVDMFNEGLDIKAIDMVMMLRPTESPTIFLQQLGRGLRKSNGKKYLNVLDFIGNYKKANFTPFLLMGTTKESGVRTREVIADEDLIPEECTIDFDARLINLFDKMDQSQMKLMDLIVEEYHRIKGELGYRPSRVELFTNLDENLYLSMKKQSKLNVFKECMGFLDKVNDLTEQEKIWKDSVAGEFVKMIENTAMSKTYKLPVLLAFIDKDELRLKADDEKIAAVFKAFYANPSNGIDLKRDKSTADYLNWEPDRYVKLAKDNPIKFLCKTEHRFFSQDESGVCLTDELKDYMLDSSFLAQVRDAVELRRVEFYRNRFYKIDNK